MKVVIPNPPSYVIVTEAGGPRWLNAQRIISMRELDDGTLIEMDNGDTLKVKEQAFGIAEYLQRPTITVFVEE